MKRFLFFLLTLMLIFSLTMLTACGGDSDNTGDNTNTDSSNNNDDNTNNNIDQKPCTEHIDANGDLLCDVCGEIVLPNTPKNVTVNFKVSDTEGNTLAGVTAILTSDAGRFSAVSDTDGLFSLTLPTGNYSVFYEYDVDALGYYLTETSSITVSKETETLTLYLLNNNPNGTLERPFTLTTGENAVKISDGASYFYRIYHAQDLYVEMYCANAEIAYNGIVYTPDENGLIRVEIEGVDTNSEVNFEVFAKGADIDTIINLTSLPGTQSNPYTIENDGELSKDGVDSEDIIYYTYTASADGVITVTLTSDNSVLSMLNKTSSVAVSTASGANTIKLDVKSGDEVLIDVSSTTEDPITVSFSISLGEKSTDLPIDEFD